MGNIRIHRELGGRSSDEEAESLKTKTSWTTDGDNTSNPEQSHELHYDESDNKRLKRHVGLNGSSSDERCQNDNIDSEYQRQKGLVRGSSDEEIESVKCKTSQGASSDPSYIPKPISYIHAETIIEVHCCEKDEKDQRRRNRGLDRVTSDEEAEFVEAKTSPTSASQLSNILNRSSYIPAEPIVKPIWKEEMVYDSLVDDMISQDLAMKALVKNAELLVFTSKTLPSQFWSE
ncbi:hypothetical protein LWI28_001363 [Acer negundo]|uniref:AIPP2-like SPOC-like domain-containing protein n=1 Tax=Acer negundo TaxID=4023 RepID=A0AAD5JS46_ACENE|nr:hypothetical protein LWI28_001363 [Acer negundo]